jgi:hypothetical protein
VINWCFEKAGFSRRGGDPAQYAFTPRLETFVREVIQNAKDQRPRGAADPVHVHFQLIELSGKELVRFQTSIGLETLKPHLEAAGANPHTLFIRKSLEALESTSSLLLLRVDDSGTGGLVGRDDEDDQPFKSLCVDELFSNKESGHAGGSYGLGKSVLWRFSSFCTVLFSSIPRHYPPGGEGLRLFGRCQVPFHTIGTDRFAGECWFGVPDNHPEYGEVRKSAWGAEAAGLAPSIFMSRERGDVGTSLLMLGFQPPADPATSPESLSAALCQHAGDNFWPVLGGQQPALRVTSSVLDAATGREHSTHEAGIGPRVLPFHEALEALSDRPELEVLTTPGDVVVVDVPMRIPARSDGTPAVDAAVSLCVRLCREQSADPEMLDRLAESRGFGMVVRYRKMSNLSLSARHFMAVLAAGTLRGDTPEDRAVEEFLRLAEPPEHDSWESNARLRSTYEPGYKKALDDMFDDVRKQLRQLVAATPTGSEAGPRLLARMFPIGDSGPTVKKQPFSIKSSTATLSPDGFWVFSGEVRPRNDLVGPWQVTVRMLVSTEDGKGDASILGDIRSRDGDSTLQGGTGTVVAAAGTTRVRFEGRSAPDLHPVDVRRAAVHLKVGAKVLRGGGSQA